MIFQLFSPIIYKIPFIGVILLTNLYFMESAVEAALENAAAHLGGPFGAVVVKDGKVIGTGTNRVTSLNDPTAHAEIQAIRAACLNLKDFQLSGCEIYTSCEPCPMCFGAIYWARPKAVYFACTKEEAASAGFDDQFIYEQLSLPLGQRSIEMKQLRMDKALMPFKIWEKSLSKINY
jgi:guanine deaminase